MSDNDNLEKYYNRQCHIITEAVLSYLPMEDRLIVIEAGSREAMSDVRWNTIEKDRLTLYGFEPDQRECDALNREANDRSLDFQYYPYGLWSESGNIEFFITNELTASSVYRPNHQLIDRFKYNDGRVVGVLHTVERSMDVEVLSIEDFLNQRKHKNDIDFLKLNTQGSELEIIKGCGSYLENVVCIQVEVSFAQSYLNAPLFSDVDLYLRKNGFVLFDLFAPMFVGRVDSPVSAITDYQISGWRWPSMDLTECHSIYFRDPIGNRTQRNQIKKFTDDKLLKLACFAEIWGQLDFSFEILVYLKKRLEDANNIGKAGEISSVIDECVSKYSVMKSWKWLKNNQSSI